MIESNSPPRCVKKSREIVLYAREVTGMGANDVDDKESANESRIARLEARVEELESQIAKLKQPPRPPHVVLGGEFTGRLAE
jgi:uncharacterized protein YceH (UPF0502 family)